MFAAGTAASMKVGRMWILLMMLQDPRSPISMARFARVFLSAIAILLLTIGSFGQTQAPMPEEALLDTSIPALSTFRVKVDEVDLSFTVRDRHNHWVTNLSEGDIRVLDNGQPPKSILKFQSQADLPLRVGLIIDTSDSVALRLGFEEKSAALFIQKVLNPATDSAFVVGFSGETTLRQNFTSDTKILANAIWELPSGGSTALYDAVHYACKKLTEHDDGQIERRVLILLTDGDDNSSKFQAQDAMDAAMRANVVIIALNTSTLPNSSDPKFKVLREMADMSGGEMLQAENEKQITKAFKEIQQELRSHYLVAYKPTDLNPDGSYRNIHLKAARRGLHIFYRHGYYAPAAVPNQEKVKY
jgi:VWFA-related protein